MKRLYILIFFILYSFSLSKCSRISREISPTESQPKSIHHYFMRFSEIETYLNNVVAQNPNNFSLEVLGRSHENRPIYALKISRSSNLPMIFMECGIHAREWASISSAIYAIDQFTKGHPILDKFQLLIVPVMNPDGYEYTHTTNRMWRKNRRNNCWNCCMGVDLNRNFGFHWGGRGSSSDRCSDIYQGSLRNSEPETRAIITGLYKYWWSIEVYLSFHTYGQYILVPYGYAKQQYPLKYDSMTEIAQYVSGILSEKFGANYTAGSSAELMYPASGGSDDFANGFMNVPYTYTIELSPSYEDAQNGFVIPVSEIVPIGQQALTILSEIGEKVWTKL